MEKKKIITSLISCLIVFLFFTTQTYSQQGWFQQNASTSTNETVNLTRVQYLDENTLIAVGGGDGVIKRSSDGGLNWTDVAINTGTLWSVHFINSQTGYVCGNNGLIMKSINGGIDWTTLNSSTSNRLWAVYFINENTGFATGSNGIILKTIDAGNSWTSSSISGGGELRKIIFVDNQTGFTAGYNGIHRTTNGGQSWSFLINEGSGLVDIIHRNNLTIAVGNGIILRSNDLGNSWIITPSLQSHLFVGASFVNDQKIIAVGRLGRIAVSNNSGSTWNISTYNNWDGFLNCVAFFNEDKGIIVGGDIASEFSKRGIIQKTDNGGASWQVTLINSSNNPPASYHYRSVYLINENVIWAATTAGALLKSENGGQTWTSTNVTNYGINKVRFINQNVGVLACNNGRILVTPNGGNTWTTFSVGNSSLTLYDVAFKNESEFYVSGSNGSIFKTIDGGTSFSQISLGSSNILRTIDVKDNLILTAGMNGKIFKSNDNAGSWSAISTNFSNNIYDVKIIDENTFIICGNSGMIRKSSDAGTSWVIQSTGIMNDFNALHYITENTGYVVGSGGIILKTQNQGDLWKIQNSTTTQPLYDVYFINENIGNAVGSNNIILRTEDGGTIGINQIAGEIPTEFRLSQNFPNPFNPSTMIRFTLAVNDLTKLDVYNIQGRLIETLVNEPLEAGIYEFAFNAATLPSGVYYYRLTTNEFTETKKMMLVK